MKRVGTKYLMCGVLLFGCIAAAPVVAKADLYNVNAVVGDIGITGPAGLYTGLTVTGTLDIGPGGVNTGTITVQNDPNLFTGFFGCPSNCSFIFNNNFDEFGLLDIGNPATFTGGSLLADSYIALVKPLGAAPTDPNYSPEVLYGLSGTVELAGHTSDSAPEPGFYVPLALGISGLLYAMRRRRIGV